MKTFALLLLLLASIAIGQTPTPSSTPTPTATPTPTPATYPVTLNWYALPPNYGVTGYEIARLVNGSYVHAATVGPNTTTYSCTTSGAQTWVVRALEPSGPSPWSNQAHSPPSSQAPQRLEATSP